VSADDTRPDLSVPLDEYAAIRGASEATAAPLDRETLGRLVHGVRLAHNAERERPFGLLPWEERDARQQELDRRIGEAVARAATEALLAALRSLCGEGAPAVAVDRIEAILGTQERTDEEAPVLSASCTGCGDQFADSETGEYEFATRDRMERLLYADGWSADPVRCPACQPEPSPAGQEAAGQIPLPGVA
jgi:predicted Zn-ribbon and HTH transcriptional regulator